MASAMRALMSGAANGGLVLQALAAPIVLTATLAPLTLWLYSKR